MKRIRRDRRDFDDSKTCVVCLRPIHTAGQDLVLGDPVPKEITSFEFRQRFWAAGRICYEDEYQPVEVDQAVDELPDDEKKELLIAKIKELGGEATRRNSINTLEKRLKEHGLEPYHLYAEGVAADDDQGFGAGDGTETGGEGSGEGNDSSEGGDNTGEGGEGNEGGDGNPDDTETGEGNTDPENPDDVSHETSENTGEGGDADPENTESGEGEGDNENPDTGDGTETGGETTTETQ